MSILKFHVQYPVILTGKHKGRLCTINNIPYWYRFQKTKIKNKFKDMLKEWCIPKSNDKYYSLNIEFTIIRPDRHRIDPDSLAGSAGKWIVDTLVEQGWLKDDDKVRISYNPTIVDEVISETMIKVEIYKNEEKQRQ